MKKIVIFFVLLLMVLPISAQVCDEVSKHGLVLIGRFDTYDTDNPHLSVRVISTPTFERKDLLIGITDDMSNNVNLKYIRIEEQDWDAFEKQMAIVDEKFKMWSQVAAMNNEKNFKKTIPANFENIVGIFGVMDPYRATRLYAVFEVNEYGKCTLRLDDWEEYNSKSSDIKSQMHIPYFIFQSPEAFHSLYELIKKEYAMLKLSLMLQIVEQAKLQEQAHNAQYD